MEVKEKKERKKNGGGGKGNGSRTDYYGAPGSIMEEKSWPGGRPLLAWIWGVGAIGRLEKACGPWTEKTTI